jgi:hypothetical protein
VSLTEIEEMLDFDGCSDFEQFGVIPNGVDHTSVEKFVWRGSGERRIRENLSNGDARAVRVSFPAKASHVPWEE